MDQSKYLLRIGAREIFCAVLEHTTKILTSPSNMDHKASRQNGFVNAEHDGLAFLIEPYYFHMVQALDSLNPMVVAQGILNKAYGGKIKMCTLEEGLAYGEALRRPKSSSGYIYKPPGIDLRYSVVSLNGSTTILDALDVYREIIEQENAMRNAVARRGECPTTT